MGRGKVRVHLGGVGRGKSIGSKHTVGYSQRINKKGKLGIIAALIAFK